MNSTTLRLQGIIPALWLGMLLTVASIATASAFAALPAADAGKVVSRVLAREAAVSLMLGAAWLALWLGMLLTVAGIATASAFAALPAADAGRVVSRALAREAAVSLMLGAAWLALDRLRVRRDDDRAGAAQFNGDVALALGAVFCTVAGYYALQPLMADARQGQSRLSFAQWHTVSLGFYGVKVLLVAALTWRSTGHRQSCGELSRSPSS